MSDETVQYLGCNGGYTTVYVIQTAEMNVKGEGVFTVFKNHTLNKRRDKECTEQKGEIF